MSGDELRLINAVVAVLIVAALTFRVVFEGMSNIERLRKLAQIFVFSVFAYASITARKLGLPAPDYVKWVSVAQVIYLLTLLWPGDIRRKRV